MQSQKAKAYIFKGSEIWINEWRMRFKMFFWVFLACVAIQATLFAVITSFLVPGEILKFIGRYYFALAAVFLKFNPAMGIELSGRHLSVDAVGLAKVGSEIVPRLIGQVWFRLTVGFVGSFGAWFLCPIMLRHFKRIAVERTQVEHIRGPQLISSDELNRQIRKEGKRTRLPLGETTIPIEYEPEHIFVAGKTRVGKTVAIMQQIEVIREAGAKAIIYDFKGDYTAKHFDSAKDFILNPLDTRCTGWTVTNEIRTKMDIAAVAQSLIPATGGDDRFWSAAAQQVFAGILSAAMINGRKSNKELWQMITMPIQQIAGLLQQTPGGEAGYTYIQDASSKQAASVIAVLMSYVAFLEFAADNDGPFTINQWLQRSEGGFIFLTGREELQDTLRPMLSLFIDLLGKKFLSLPDEKDRRIFFILDEFGTLQKLPTIKRLLTAGGSKGAIVEIGIQDFAGLKRIYGPDDAVTIFNSCGNNLVLNVADPETAKFFSDRFGKYQYWDTNETQSMGVSENRDGISLSRQKFLEDLILPSEIQGLPKLQGFVKIPEHNPARVKIPITPANNRPDICPAFICRAGYDLDEIAARQVAIKAQAEAVEGFDHGSKTEKNLATNIDDAHINVSTSTYIDELENGW